MSDLLKRPGRVYVSRSLIEENAETIQGILGALLIVEARPRFVTNDVEYIGYSEQFEEQDDGNVIPEYTINVTQEGDDISVEFVKED
jgi:hypothetical protein